ncbi:MAG TPA: glycosyltransferase family 4 protein [Hymenobacter sp.]|jgi:glycosyltransferase involved in cell wall biosynthesis|uniref:glycosyltransferase family 4 protein n=1 Tax=Hymenobacter sp. TaxID=1898978 RepID=UPI002ED942E2
MKILLSAYACDPAKGSEEGTGFHYLWETAALGHEVWCLTTPRGRDNLEQRLAERADDPVAARIHPVYVAVPPAVDFLYRWQFGVYVHYIAWQRAAWHAAQPLDQRLNFDLVHHITYNSLQMASWLWRLRKPLLLGPLGGGMQAPASLRKYLPGWFKTETLRNVVGQLLTAFDPNVRQSLRRAALVFVANRETAALARQLGARRVELAMSTAQPASFFPAAYQPRPPLAGRELRILWLARVYPRKGLHLVLDALGRVDKRVPFHLDIMGDGPVGHLVPGWIAEAGLQDRVTWHGQVPYATIRAAYLGHDLFMLCSLRDTFAAQYVEAMALGLPILTLDHHGATDFIPDDAGVKVPVQSAEATADALARAVERLYDHPEELASCGRAGFAFASRYSWPQLARELHRRAAAAAPELAGLAPAAPLVAATAS